MESVYGTAFVLGVIGWVLLGFRRGSRSLVRTVIGIIVIASAVLIALSAMFGLPVISEGLSWCLHWLSVILHWVADSFESGSVYLDRAEL